MNRNHGAVLIAAAVMAAMPAEAQSPVRTERVQFARGATSATVRGSVRGYQTVDHVVAARSGQSMSVSLQTTSKSAYFNVLPPRSEEALFNGSVAGSRFEGRLRVSGDYRVRIYLMRNAARRGERADYGVTIAVRNGTAGSGTAPSPVGSGTPVTRGNMPAFCRGEASAQFGVRPAYLKTGQVVSTGQGSAVEGTADRGRDGTTRFRCRFDAHGRFIDVTAIARG